MDFVKSGFMIEGSSWMKKVSCQRNGEIPRLAWLSHDTIMWQAGWNEDTMGKKDEEEEGSICTLS
jgi:hypothetical protein